jgi:hypothetical protein
VYHSLRSIAERLWAILLRLHLDRAYKNYSQLIKLETEDTVSLLLNTECLRPKLLRLHLHLAQQKRYKAESVTQSDIIP